MKHLLLYLFAFTASTMAQAITFTVSETAGLRRFGYPVTASLECDRGAVASLEKIRLTSVDGREVPAQFTVMSEWPDGSVRSLDVDFSPSPGPLETQSYHVDTGKAPSAPLRAGLTVTETADEVIVASAAIAHHIRRDGRPLLRSITFGEHEFIGADGLRTTLTPGPVQIVKRGPFNVTLNCGPVRLEYVNTKSWVKITQRAGSERELAVDATFVLNQHPLLWDFGAGSWLYGHLSKAGQGVTLRHHDVAWDIATAPDTVFARSKLFDGCGHFADARNVIAFGIADASDDITVDLRSDGHIRIAARREALTTWFHFVGQPIPVTAVTSPQAMISPLKVAQ